MKKIVAILTICAFAFSLCVVNAQNLKQQAKEREEIRKQSEKELKRKPSKDAKKQAKELKKQGWTVTAGSTLLEKQIDQSLLMQMEKDENNNPRYIWGEAMSIGENYDAARMQAIELAKINLAQQLETEIAGRFENAVANKQLKADDAASVMKTVGGFQSLIIQKITRITPVVQCYRVLPNKNKEVLVRVAYNSSMAYDAVKAVLREQLENESDEILKSMESIIDGSCAY